MSTTFTLISLGSRGVGKTVFLASNCAKVLRSSQKKSNNQTLWFECLDQEFQEKIEKLVGYVVRTGQYPPPTFKIEDFTFSLRGKSFSGTKTFCHFRWLDLPGEWCNIQNTEFQSVLLQSHGCCIFVDAHALMSDETYLAEIEAIMNQVEAIASLANQHHLKYPLALICTKCDLVNLSPIGLVQLEAKLMPILKRLDAVTANYRRFYSAIPTLDQAKSEAIKFSDTNAPLLWLISELQKLHGTDTQVNLGNSLNRIISSSINGSTEASRAHNASESKTKLFRNWKSFGSQKAILFILLACGFLSAIIALSLKLNVPHSETAALTPKQKLQKYEAVLQIDASNQEALNQVVNAYVELGQPDQAVVHLDKVLKTSSSDINTLLQLAGLYALAGQDDKEENIYDRILSKESNNIFILTNKANLRRKKGDLKTAKLLYEKAQKAAPTKDLKLMINNLSKVENEQRP
jgi:tetratricopeptide (TPR) repeat protein